MIRRATRVTVMAIRAATTGENSAGRMTLFSTALKWMASSPPATQVAPIRPPKSACDELEGRPRNQVSRFHRIAPTSPAKITTGLMSVSSTSPREIVFATCTDRKAPARFRQPAIATATLGRNAPVAMEVAMAFAVSWNPLVKSKISAVSTTTITATSMGGAFQSTAESGRVLGHLVDRASPVVDYPAGLVAAPTIGGVLGLGDGLGEVPATADERPAPWRDSLDLDLEGEAQERPDQHDQSEDGHPLDRRLDRHGAHQVGGHQDLQAEQQHAAERPAQELVGGAALPGAPPDPPEHRQRQQQAQDEDGRAERLAGLRHEVHALGEGHSTALFLAAELLLELRSRLRVLRLAHRFVQQLLALR